MGRKKQTLAIYGNVHIPRGWCPSCKTHAFIQDDCFLCCGEKIETDPKAIKRMSFSDFRKKSPSKKEQKILLEKFENKCAYCDRIFGSFIWYKNKSMCLRRHWDHITPWAYDQDNRNINFLPACHVCNGFKSSKIFETLEEAREYLHERWKKEETFEL